MEEDLAKPYNKTVDSAAASTSEPPPHQDDKDSEKSEKVDYSLNDVVSQKNPDYYPNPTSEKHFETSTDRDVALARVESEKRLAFVRAWEESEKTKADNKACKKLSMVGLWEERKKASVQVQIKKMEEGMEKKKADYVEKMKNKLAEIRQLAEEKKAVIEAKKYEDFLKVQENAAKYRSRGYTPRKFHLLSCFKPYNDLS